MCFTPYAGRKPLRKSIDKPPHKGGSVVGSFLNLADDVGSSILGREPSVFLDRYFADVRRINGATNALDFLVRGSRFIQAQDVYKKEIHLRQQQQQCIKFQINIHLRLLLMISFLISIVNMFQIMIY